MSHQEQREFIRTAINSIPNRSELSRIIEIGSYDVNGEIRSQFDSFAIEQYVGVDLVDGPGVDIVGFGHEIQLPSESFDIAISAECFEHDEFWKETFAKMVDLVRPGGWIIFTCAGRGRPEHGTSRTDPVLSPGTSSLGLQYYKNLRARDFEASIEMGKNFSKYQFIENNDVFDLYFVGQRANDAEPSENTKIVNDDDLRRIRKLTKTVPTLVWARAPLRIMSRLLPEGAYQEFAYRYWKALIYVHKHVLGSRFAIE
jgi:SAM-dependent methyltransferase